MKGKRLTWWEHKNDGWREGNNEKKEGTKENEKQPKSISEDGNKCYKLLI